MVLWLPCLAPFYLSQLKDASCSTFPIEIIDFYLSEGLGEVIECKKIAMEANIVQETSIEALKLSKLCLKEREKYIHRCTYIERFINKLICQNMDIKVDR